jgi:hypothetical protein
MVADLSVFDQARRDVMEPFKKFEGMPVHAHGAQIHAADYTHTWRNRAGLGELWRRVFGILVTTPVAGFERVRRPEISP